MVVCHSGDGGKYAILWWSDSCIKWCKAKRSRPRPIPPSGGMRKKLLGLGGGKRQYDEVTSPGSDQTTTTLSSHSDAASAQLRSTYAPHLGSKVHSIPALDVVAVDAGANTKPFECRRRVEGSRCFSILTGKGSLDVECMRGERDAVIAVLTGMLKGGEGVV